MLPHFSTFPRILSLAFLSLFSLISGCGDPIIYDPRPPSSCTTHTECPSGLCFLGFPSSRNQGLSPNTCATSAQVLYVDSNHCQEGGPDDFHKGTVADPFCQVTSALKKGSLIVVKPPKDPNGYQGITLQKGNTAFIVGTSRTSKTSIQGIQLQDPETEAYLYGLTLATHTNLQSMTSRTGLSCTNQAAVTLVESTVASNTNGVIASSCKHLHLEKSFIGNNANQGISVTQGSSYRILNSLIVQNGGIGITFGMASGLFAFNSVVQNGKDLNVSHAQKGGALLCLPEADPSGKQPLLVQNTLVVGNQIELTSPSPTQIQGNTCQLKNVVVSTKDTLPSIHSSSQNISKSNVTFVETETEWQLNLVAPLWDPSLVIDQADPNLADLVKDDYFHTLRPRAIDKRGPGGTGYDIGHQQVPIS